MKLTAWITWEKQPRNKSMAALVDADYYELTEYSSGIKRYLNCLTETVKVFNSGYDVVFVQNPSIVLAFAGVVLSKVYRTKVVIDAHNAGVRPKEGNVGWLLAVNNWILRRADLVIVTNCKLQDHLESIGVQSVIIPDPLPQIPTPAGHISVWAPYVFVICSWAEDEPIEVYLETARLRPDRQFLFSGNSSKYAFSSLPDNIILLGYVSESEYYRYLANASVVIDLTTRDDCLVCGAYESIALDKKVVLSDTTVNRELFGGAAIYSANDAESLALALDEDLSSPIAGFKESYMLRLQAEATALLELIL